LAKEPVPEQVNIAYGEMRLAFGKDYIIPKPFDPRLIAKIPPAVAKAAIKSGVAQSPINDWDKYEENLLDRMNADNKIVRLLFDRAKSNPKRVVFAEADQLDVLKAAQIVHEEGIAKPILLGNKKQIEDLKLELEFDADVPIIDPKDDEYLDQKNKYGEVFWKQQKRKGQTLLSSNKIMRERNYFAAMMVNEGDADALITGYSRNYPSIVKPMLDLIGLAPGSTRIATTNVMITGRGPMFLSDTAININPSAHDLIKITQMTSGVMKLFGITPVMAMLSYSNFGSSKDQTATKVREAVAYLHRRHPDLSVDGELQTDFALNSDMLKANFPFSKLANKKVNALIFPNLESANITYKLLKELNNAESIGPIMMGLRKPVHIIQFGASVDEIVNMTAVAVVDAQQKEKA
jgi:malate dehydrogenase (oxaloacetate-decarboxylating)(NADP+)